MFVGTARLVLLIPSARSLKDKRMVVRRCLDRLRAKLHVASAEVDDQDVHRRAVLGLAVVSNDGRHARSMLDQAIATVASAAAPAELVSRQTSVEVVGSHQLRDDWALPSERADEDEWTSDDFEGAERAPDRNENDDR